jgi:hypothetical protein
MKFRTKIDLETYTYLSSSVLFDPLDSNTILTFIIGVNSLGNIVTFHSKDVTFLL